MEELKQVVFLQLRRGKSIATILNDFKKIEEELITMKDYARAIEEADKAP